LALCCARLARRHALARRAERDFLDAISSGRTSFGAGLFFGYQFGPHAGIEWGFELFATQRFAGWGCSSQQRYGIGPLLQLGIMETHDPRLTLALNAGGELFRMALSLSAELGVSYRFGSEPGFALHLGLVPETMLANAALRYELFRRELWLGGGLRFWPTYGAPSACDASDLPLRDL
jgi:hypothetical protein